MYRVSHKKRFDSSFYITHPKIIRFGNTFQLITCQLSPISVGPNINISETSGLFRISIFLEKARFPFSQDLATFKFPKKNFR